MRKLLLLTTAAFLISGVSFADNGKKKKKCAKGKTCCSKSAKSSCKPKADKTVKI
jgi:hypothetical protein